MPSYAFPFSPAEIERGQVFEFHLNHVVHTTSPFELVRTRWSCSAAPESAAMPRLKEVCRYVRSKNAGPFWMTVDLFFDSDENYARISRRSGDLGSRPLP